MISYRFLDGVDDFCDMIEDSLRGIAPGFRIFDSPLPPSQQEGYNWRAGNILPYGIWHRRHSHTSSELRVKGLTIHNLDQYSWQFQMKFMDAILEILASAGLRIDRS